jgi:peroxiredoxin
MSTRGDKRMKRLLVGLVAGLMVVVLAGACGSQGDLAGSGSGSETMSNLAEASVPEDGNQLDGLESGQTVPDFVLTYGDGETVKLSDWRGQPVVINFWATWCSPCRAEMPEIVEAFERYQEEDLVVVGVNVQESADKASEFAEEFQMSFPIALDSRGEIQQLYQVRGLPTTFFIDREGRLTARWAGLLTKDLLAEYLSEIL